MHNRSMFIQMKGRSLQHLKRQKEVPRLSGMMASQFSPIEVAALQAWVLFRDDRINSRYLSGTNLALILEPD